jgi:hypothetical protein
MSQSLRIQWTIKPKELPSILKNCSKCKEKKEFKNSKKFRVNANGSQLDIWLIYRCESCETTYNLTVLERMEAGRVDKEEYKGFLSNSIHLAAKYGNDRELFGKNKAEMVQSHIDYEVIARNTTIACNKESMIEAEIRIPVGFDLRVDALLVRQFSISRSTAKKWCETGIVLNHRQPLSHKSKVRDLMVLQILPPVLDSLTKS